MPGAHHISLFLVSMKAKSAARAPRKRASSRGRPPAHEVATREQRLLDVATEVFLKKGFKGASMIEIARRAGASKQTLYARYPSKAALFAALVERRASGLFQAIGPLDGSRSLRETLVDFGCSLLDLILSEDARGLYRVVTGESIESPELGELFWKLGPGRTRAMLADYLRAQQQKGVLQCGDPHHAVTILHALIISVTLGLDSPFLKTPAQRRAWVNSAVDTFLAAMEAPK
jgi:TetR/AcrR family transcriptional regulator, mexJK operon transcriptional repressor